MDTRGKKKRDAKWREKQATLNKHKSETRLFQMVRGPMKYTEKAERTRQRRKGNMRWEQGRL